jgi:hypothetical protein
MLHRPGVMMPAMSGIELGKVDSPSPGETFLRSFVGERNHLNLGIGYPVSSDRIVAIGMTIT